ncbi:transcription antitermination factor NusB [Desulfovibrio sp.]|uniref:transcription antitermination factor NusB n=1 Tax=Desulfovibrio sp. TaxID=885 RepID=UPI0023D093A7|nr:transcription antitermination factor NusB [Desulfovibrio sp.]MDE7240563.1 transcription antitermination factor NusB [Desulfovibrio sp.]
MAGGRKPTRRSARELAFQVLYGLCFSPAPDRAALWRQFVLSPHNAGMSEADLEREPSGFAWELVDGVWSHTPELDEAIGRYSRNWRVDRLGRIELTILRLALFELFWRDAVPPKAAINEALELAREFGDEKARAFLNGILDAAARGAAAREGAAAPDPDPE